jgi:hypothetical protein
VDVLASCAWVWRPHVCLRFSGGRRRAARRGRCETLLGAAAAGGRGRVFRRGVGLACRLGGTGRRGWRGASLSPGRRS